MNKNRHGDILLMMFILLLFAGFLVGAGFAAVGFPNPSIVFRQSPTDTGFVSVFSGFLFDFVPFLVVIYLFGMTFLGIAVIPVTLFIKGLLAGISQTSLLLQRGNAFYIRQWLTYLPAAALCLAVLISFSLQAMPVSLKYFRSVFGHSTDITTKNYGVKFLAALFMCIALGLFRYLCSFSLLIFS